MPKIGQGGVPLVISPDYKKTFFILPAGDLPPFPKDISFSLPDYQDFELLPPSIKTKIACKKESPKNETEKNFQKKSKKVSAVNPLEKIPKQNSPKLGCNNFFLCQ